ncbi:MAG: pyridoxamine kinase [Lachnospiraceae bacterium]|nr:pyridoxamine kinase [Lachnospiraceae bacterium]
MKRIITIQDISCIGKCSLTVALPILSAMGLETAVLPTAVLSTHTMFENPVFVDLTEQIRPISDHWEREGFGFEAIYTGYLGSARQIELVTAFFQRFKRENTLLFVDPAMADHGKLYSGFSPSFPEEMKKLCSKADLIIPNLTEASLLTGIPYQEQQDEAWLHKLLDGLSALGPRFIVLTGCSLSPGRIGVLSRDCAAGRDFSYDTEKLPVSYHGTGDIFASTVLGGLENGMNLSAALKLACGYVKDTVQATIRNPASRRYGVDFETTLPGLIRSLEAFRSGSING